MNLRSLRLLLPVLATALLIPAIANAQSEWTSGTISYDGLGNIVSMGTDVYVYDSAGRLVSGTANQQQSGASAKQDYSYDAFGNRLTVTTTGTTCVGRCAPSATVSTINNRITDNSAAYDAAEAGHMTRFGNETYTYDGADMVSSVSDSTIIQWEFVYTADDERLATYTGQGNWRFTVRDMDQKVLREFTAYQGTSGTTTWSWERDHVYRNGLLLATIYPTGDRQQFHLDHLGSPRLVTNGNGLRIGQHAYYPFGDELLLQSNEFQIERMKFTGHERDTLGSDEPADYMHARFFSATAGRFLSVDRKGRYTPTATPQGWNRYVYGLNTPLKFIDENGLENTLYVINLYARRETGGVNLGGVATTSGKYKVVVVAPYGGKIDQVISTRKQMDATDHIVVTHHSAPFNGEGIMGSSSDVKGGNNSAITGAINGNELGKNIAGTSGTSVFIGCDSKELAQTIANATGAEAAGTVHGTDTVQAVNAAAAYATIYALTGSTDAALDAANQQLTKTVCDSQGKNCGVGQLEIVEPKPPEE